MQEKNQSRVEEIEMEVFRKWCLENYNDVFKNQLEWDDVIKCEKELEIFVEESDKVKPINIITPTETPIHLQKAAKRELDKILKVDILDPCPHPTDWCFCGFYVKKPHIREGEEMRVRLVSDFPPLNCHLKRLGHPNKSSSQ